jgi:hypothetical protein
LVILFLVIRIFGKPIVADAHAGVLPPEHGARHRV